jgi:hypothetical protein
MLITPTTKIESVNSMLSAVGEAPITNLDEDLAEAQIAVSILDEVSREVQSQGWTWNTERKRKFIISSNGEILLPVNTLKVEAVHETSGLPDRSKRFTMRDRKLFDLVNHTYVFTKDQFIDRVYGLAFPDLTESARRFITLDATTRYMTNVLGADADLQQVQQQAQRSWIQLNWEEDSMSDNNMMTDEPLMSYTVERLL